MLNQKQKNILILILVILLIILGIGYFYSLKREISSLSQKIQSLEKEKIAQQTPSSPTIQPVRPEDLKPRTFEINVGDSGPDVAGATFSAKEEITLDIKNNAKGDTITVSSQDLNISQFQIKPQEKKQIKITLPDTQKLSKISIKVKDQKYEVLIETLKR